MWFMQTRIPTATCLRLAMPESSITLQRSGSCWSKLAEAWFPKGSDDPDLALVQLRIAHASYWDVKETKIMQLFKMAKAAATGKAPVLMGAHAEVRMR